LGETRDGLRNGVQAHQGCLAWGGVLIARAWQGTRADNAKRDSRLVLGHCYGKCRTRMQSWKLADEATDERRQGGSPLSTYFSTCRQRQEGSPPRTRTLLRKVSYSDAPRTQSRNLAAEAATGICTKFSDTRDSASDRRSRRTREALGRWFGQWWYLRKYVERATFCIYPQVRPQRMGGGGDTAEYRASATLTPKSAPYL